jgi:hypothetical protein
MRKGSVMKKTAFFIAVLCLGVAVATSSSFAEDKALSDEGEVSFVQTDGNTKVTSLSAINLVKYKFTRGCRGAGRSARCVRIHLT